MTRLTEPAFILPAEWEMVEAVWMGWPIAEGLWKEYDREIVEQDFRMLTEVISRFAPVRYCVEAAELDRVSAIIPEAEGYPIATDDVWCRDYGATFVKDRCSGAVRAVDWTFNAWGGKFRHSKDAAVVSKICEALGIPRVASRLTCEGGALDSNGAGRLLTTESVLLNLNRNGGWSREEVTCELEAMLGIDEVIWLEAGLENDDTDGHVDMVARFVGEEEVLVVEPQTEALRNNWRQLGNAGLSVEGLPFVGEFAPGVDGSYANFLMVNQGVVVPQYQLASDREALAIIRNAFPKHEVVGYDCTLLGLEGGGVHCLTQGQWR